MSPEGGIYTNLLSIPDEKVTSINPQVKNQRTLAYTVIGESFQIRGNEIPAVAEDLEFGKMFWELSRELLAEGKVKVHRPSVDVYGKGLEGALKVCWIYLLVKGCLGPELRWAMLYVLVKIMLISY